MKLNSQKPHPGLHVRTRKIQTAFLLGCSVSALALTAFVGPAFAQTAAPAAATAGDETVVVVTGIRKSLKTSQGLKKDSDVVQDTVTAEDIGALPDRSVTEALQRLPGVNISRFVGNNDTNHFAVEGFGVTIRGLGMTRSELNGRDVFSASNGRGLYFGEVASELVSGVDVFKSPSADAVEGGIGGTVNLRTRVPFDSKKPVVAFSLDYTYDDLIKKGTPTASVLLSRNWDTDIGKFGVLVDFVSSEIKTRSDSVSILDYQCVNTFHNDNAAGSAFDVVTPQVADCNGDGTKDGVYVPQGARMSEMDSDHKRKGFALAAQWQSNDDTMLATFQYLRSESTLAWSEHVLEAETDNIPGWGGTYPVFGTSTKYDSQGVFTDGTLSASSCGWGCDNPNYPRYGLAVDGMKRDQLGKFGTSDTSFNFKWTPNDKWGFKFDIQHVESTTDQTNAQSATQAEQDIEIHTDGSNIPTIKFLMPSTVNGSGSNPDSAGYASGSDLTMPATNQVRNFMDHIERSTGTETAIRIDGEYAFDENDWLQALDFGVRSSDRKQINRATTYNWGWISAPWGGLTFADQGAAADWKAFSFPGFFRGDAGNPDGTGRVFYAPNGATDYAHYVAAGEGFPGDHGCGSRWVGLADRTCEPLYDTYFQRNEINRQNERNDAAYVMLKFKHEDESGSKVTGNIGLRYVEMTRSAPGYIKYPTYLAASDNTSCLTAPGNISYMCTHMTDADRAALQTWADGHIVDTNGDFSYNYLLPSFNLKIAPNNALQFRFGWSQTINQTDMGLTRSLYGIGINDLNNPTFYLNGKPTGKVTAGNPRLKPIHSDNIDLTAEWYFVPNGVGSLTVAYFSKSLTNVVTNGSETLSFTNNGQTYQVQAITAVNSPATAKIQGLEFNYQQVYDFLPAPFDGVGVQANYTYIDSHGIPQKTLNPEFGDDSIAGHNSTVDTSKLPYEGLSKNNVNLEVFYEKKSLSMRLAYNWRSDFLVTAQDVISPFQPIMQKASGQLDGSIMYQLTPQVKIGLQAQNLNNSTTRLTAVVNNQLLEAGHAWLTSDRRVSFVVRGNF